MSGGFPSFRREFPETKLDPTQPNPIIADEASPEEYEQNLAMEIKQKDQTKEEAPGIDEEEDEEEQEPAPGPADMRAALELLHRGLQESDYPAFEEFWRIEKDIKKHLSVKFPRKQTTLSSFFKTT